MMRASVLEQELKAEKGLGQCSGKLTLHFSAPMFQLKTYFSTAETTEMSGKCVVALATDPNILSLSGKVLPSYDLARRYGLQDVDGRPIQDYLSLSSVLSYSSSLGWLAPYLPGFLRMPSGL
ncbi:unnamed protein product [Pipistrellus nathusii]|uniref:Uncharacterized protein n=1 Tax=Pipistrellus nathusii TaxID=59473 RepID=A0ABN9Z2N0_PIPNA